MNNFRSRMLMTRVEGVDCIAVMNAQQPFVDSTFHYLTENQSGSFENCLLLIFPEGRIDVIVSSMEVNSARQGKGNIHVYSTLKEREGLMKELLEGVKRIGVNSSSVTMRNAESLQKMIPSVELVDVSEAIASTRSIKDRSEIESIRRACKITSRVAQDIPEFLKDGLTEKEVRNIIDMKLREKGGDGNAFNTIVAFAENASEPHHEPQDRALKIGDVALFDFGCTYEGYCSDLTRTLFRGVPTSRLSRAYETVRKAKIEGMSMIKAGVKASDVDMAARRVIDESEFEGLFIHSFGHEIGINVHDGGSISRKSNLVLQENMVVSAEPGIYIEGLGGIRIEDTVLILEDGCEALTDFDQSLTVI